MVCLRKQKAQNHYRSNYFYSKPCRNIAKTVQPRLQVVDDLQCQFIRLGQIVQIGKALVFQPENIQAGFVTRDDLLVIEFSPAAFRILLAPGFLPLMAVERVVTADELLQILEAQRLFFQRVMDIGAVIEVPHFLSPRLFAGSTIVEEQHIRFHAVGVKNAGGQSQNGMQLGGFQQLLA